MKNKQVEVDYFQNILSDLFDTLLDFFNKTHYFFILIAYFTHI